MDAIFKRGRPSDYPWNLWMNGERHIARRGLDFHSSVRSFASGLYGRARSDSTDDQPVKVRTKIEGDAVYFQFYRIEKGGAE